MEMYYASIYALAINKQWKIKHDIISSDSPDIIFINQDNKNDRIGIEIYEAYNHEDKDRREVVDIGKEVKKLYQKKGNKKYNIESRLLIINRVKSKINGYNVSDYSQCLEKYEWNFTIIILCIYREYQGAFSFFYVGPKKMGCNEIDFSYKSDRDSFY